MRAQVCRKRGESAASGVTFMVIQCMVDTGLEEVRGLRNGVGWEESRGGGGLRGKKRGTHVRSLVGATCP
jgi:hypothetical protein